MKKLIFTLVISALCLYLPAFGSNDTEAKGTLKGTVTDKDGLPVEFVNVLLENARKGASTDQNGHYIIYNVQPGTYVVRVSGLNIEPLRKEVSIGAGETVILDFSIAESASQLRELTVTGSALRQMVVLPEVEGTAIYAAKKNEVILVDKVDANLVTNNTRQVFAKVPGLSVWENDGAGIQVGVAVRGLSPNRSWEFNVRQNGYDVSADIFGYPEAYYNPPMEAVEQIQVVRGAASLQYGAQFGGLLNYVLKKGAADRPFTFETQNTTGSYGLLSSFNAIGGTKGKLNYYAYFHRRSADGWRENSRYSIWHAYANVNYQFTEKFRVGVEVTRMNFENQQSGGLTDAQFAQNPRQSGRERNWFSTPWFVPVLTAEYNVSERTTVTMKTFGLIAERNSIGFVAGAAVPDTINRATGNFNPRQIDRDFYRNWGTELRMLTRYQLGNMQNTLAVGARYFDGQTDRRQQGRGDTGFGFNLDLQTAAFPRDLAFQSRNVAFFAENIFKLSDRFTVTPGIRYEFIRSTGNGRIGMAANGTPLNIDPQQADRSIFLAGVGAEYRTNATTSLYANITQAYRPVMFADQTPPATTDVIDENLKDASGFNMDFGYRGRMGNFLNFDLGGFYLLYDNRIGNIRRFRDGSTTDSYIFRTNLGTSVATGFEGYVEFDPLSLLSPSRYLGSLNLFSSFAFIKAEYTDFVTSSLSGGNIVEGNLRGNRVENAPEIINRGGVTYAYKGFSATFQASHVGEVFADAANVREPNAAGTAGLIPAYTVMDLAASLRFNKHYVFRAGVNNLADTAYFTRRAGGYPGPGLIPGEGRTWFFSVGARF